MWEVRRHRQACASCRARVSLRVAATLVVRLVTTGPACPSRRVSTPWMCVCVWEHGVPHQGSRQVRPGGYSPHSWSGRDELGADPHEGTRQGARSAHPSRPDTRQHPVRCPRHHQTRAAAWPERHSPGSCAGCRSWRSVSAGGQEWFWLSCEMDGHAWWEAPGPAVGATDQSLLQGCHVCKSALQPWACQTCAAPGPPSTSPRTSIHPLQSETA